MLAIALDGYTHQVEEIMEKDEKKEIRLNDLGVNILRFQDVNVYNDVENVIREIAAYIVEFNRTHPH